MKRSKHYKKQKEIKAMRKYSFDYTITNSQYEREGNFVTFKCDLILKTNKSGSAVITIKDLFNRSFFAIFNYEFR